jgi:hypothetical protein
MLRTCLPLKVRTHLGEGDKDKDNAEEAILNEWREDETVHFKAPKGEEGTVAYGRSPPHEPQKDGRRENGDESKTGNHWSTLRPFRKPVGLPCASILASFRCHH